MCLTSNIHEISKELKALAKNGIKKYYKVLKYDGKHLVSPYKNQKYQAGPNYASRPKRNRVYEGTVHGVAVHVFKCRKHANNLAKYDFKHDNAVVVEVTGYLNNFISAGVNDCCFNRIYLSEEEYKRAIAKAICNSKEFQHEDSL